MEKTRTRVLTWMALAFYAFFWVALDLWSTGIALSMGFYEKNALGNQPFLAYPVALFAMTLCYLAALNAEKHNIFYLTKGSLLVTLMVASLPVVAVLSNLAVIGYV